MRLCSLRSSSVNAVLYVLPLIVIVATVGVGVLVGAGVEIGVLVGVRVGVGVFVGAVDGVGVFVGIGVVLYVGVGEAITAGSVAGIGEEAFSVCKITDGLTDGTSPVAVSDGPSIINSV